MSRSDSLIARKNILSANQVSSKCIQKCLSHAAIRETDRYVQTNKNTYIQTESIITYNEVVWGKVGGLNANSKVQAGETEIS